MNNKFEFQFSLDDPTLLTQGENFIKSQLYKSMLKNRSSVDLKLKMSLPPINNKKIAISDRKPSIKRDYSYRKLNNEESLPKILVKRKSKPYLKWFLLILNFHRRSKFKYILYTIQMSILISRNFFHHSQVTMRIINWR